MSRRTKSLILLVACGLITLGAFLAMTVWKPPEKVVVAIAPRKVLLQPVTRSTFRPVHEGVGLSMPILDAVIAAEATGRVLFVAMEGKAVAQNEIVARLDTREARQMGEGARARYRQALSRRNQLQRDVERYRRLEAAKAIARQTLENAESDLAAAEAVLAESEFLAQESESRETKHTLRSPFAGNVLERIIDVGEVVAPGTALARVGNLDTLTVEIEISEELAMEIKSGTRAVVEFDALPGETFTTHVVRVDKAINPTSRVAKVVLHIPNTDRRLAAGMLARATVQGEPVEVITIPRKVVLEAPEGMFVWIAVDGKASLRRVELGARNEDNVEIRSGLPEGSLLILNAKNLLEGTPVTGE